MSWWDALISAGAGYMNAQQANKPRNTRTNQTTTQTPFGLPLIGGDIEAAIDYQRQLMAQGPRYIGTGNTGGGGGGGRRRAVAGGGGTAAAGGGATWTNSRGQLMTTGPDGRPVRAGGSAGAPTSTTRPGGGAPQGIDAISNEVARRGLEAGNAPYIQDAQRGVQNILGGQPGAGGSATGSGFQGHNPINDFLAGELRGDVSERDAANMIRQFLGEDFGDNAGGGIGGGRRERAPGGGLAGYYATQGGYGAGAPAGGAGAVPDTVGGSNSYFATQLRQLMDSPRNDADLQAIIDAQNADVLRGMQSDQWALDAQAQGTGRFGGDMWASLANQSRADASREMGTNASRARLAEQESRRAMYQNLLGQVNTRDLGAMQDATQRYGIGASASAAGAGASEAAALQRRGQNLQALMGLLQNDQFNIGAMGDLGGQLSSDQLAAMGMTPSLAGIWLSGLGAANNAVGNLVGQQGNQTSLRNAQIAAGTARAGLNQQAQLYNSQLPWDNVNNYLRNIGLVGGMGGSSTTVGENVVPGMGVNPWLAAGMAGYAGYTGWR